MWQIIYGPFQVMLQKMGEALGTDFWMRKAFFTAYIDTSVDMDSPSSGASKGKAGGSSAQKALEVLDGFLSKFKFYRDNFYLGGAFSGITLPGFEIDNFQIISANRKVPYQAPRGINYTNVTLRRGLTVVGSPFWLWLKKFHDEDYVERKDVTIIHLARAGQVLVGLGNIAGYVGWVPVAAYKLYSSVPVRLSWGELDALSSDIVIEEVEIIYNNFDYVSLIEIVDRLFPNISPK